MKVLITGAAGRIGRALARGLASDHSLRLADLFIPPDANEGEWIQCDVTNAADAAHAVAGVDAVIHLAGHPNSADWGVVTRLNIGGTLAMLQASVAAGVDRFLFASSIHAFGMHPADVALTNDLDARPDGPYGWSKASGELLVRTFSELHGLTAIALRICSFRPEPTNARELATWLSYGDMVRLAQSCLASDVQGFVSTWGLSANSAARVDDHAWRSLRYCPEDNAADHRVKLASRGVDVSRFSEWPFLGGPFVANQSSEKGLATAPQASEESLQRDREHPAMPG